MTYLALFFVEASGIETDLLAFTIYTLKFIRIMLTSLCQQPLVFNSLFKVLSSFFVT